MATALVELLVYSGRANPVLELTQAETDELLRRLDLPADAAPPPAPPGLGYGGVQITRPGADGHVVAYGGVLVDSGGGRSDTAGVEGWLLDLARERGYAELLTALGV
jgi:hypothetical protein